MNAIKTSTLALLLLLAANAPASQAAPFKWPTATDSGANPAQKMPAQKPAQAIAAPKAAPSASMQKPVQPGLHSHSQQPHHQHARAAASHQTIAHQANVVALPAVRVIKKNNGECIAISTDKLFDPDQATLMPAGEELLSKQVARIGNWSEHPIVIEVHADNFGFESYIRKLSQQRAEKLKAWFVQRGLMQDVQVEAIGAGKDHPLFANQFANGKDDHVAMANNRRVEIAVDMSKAVTAAAPVQQPTPLDGMIHPQQTEWPTDGSSTPATETSTATAEEKQQQPATPALDENGDPIAVVRETTGNPIIDSLPRLEDVKRHSGGTQDISTEPEKPQSAGPTEEQLRQRAWEKREFGLWQDDN